MALGKCPDCDGKVSTTATVCPHCGNTQFDVRTGRLVDVVCFICNGTPREKACGLCHGSGQHEVPEWKDLRDDSLFARPYSGSEFKIRFE